MTKLGQIISNWLVSFRNEYRSTNAHSLMEHIADEFSRIRIDVKKDFSCTYEITAEGLTMRLTPISDYGEFIMRKVYDAECKNVLDSK